ncbi:MAG TPA: hypothetical protein VFZ65_13225 [Planctomycetota bacterium]|nr:hypothetical protein [Planctomycetota bacterium]
MNKLALSLAFSLVAPVAMAQCVIHAPGVSLNQNGVLFDGWTASQPIGFAFPFGGATYTGMYISDHGLVALNNGGVPAVPLGGAFLWNPATANLVVGGPIIAPYWSDANIGPVPGDIYIDNTSGNHCTVTWLDHQTYLAQNPPFTVQMTLYSDGRVVLCLDSRVNNQGSTFGALNAIMGMSPGTPAVLPAPSNISSGPVVAVNTIFEEWTTTAAGTPNPLFDVANSEITFVPTNPGWVVIVGPLPCAAKATYGTGCAGLALDSNVPVLGTNWTLTTTGIAAISPVGITFFGTTRVDPGLPLIAIGIASPGCNVHINGVLSNLSAPNVGGTATLNIPVPLSATIKGTVLTAQSLGLTLAFPSLIATSNGLEGVLGY